MRHSWILPGLICLQRTWNWCSGWRKAASYCGVAFCQTCGLMYWYFCVVKDVCADSKGQGKLEEVRWAGPSVSKQTPSTGQSYAHPDQKGEFRPSNVSNHKGYIWHSSSIGILLNIDTTCVSKENAIIWKDGFSSFDTHFFKVWGLCPASLSLSRCMTASSVQKCAPDTEGPAPVTSTT